MNTQSHAIINLYLLRRFAGEDPLKEKGTNGLILLGAVLPDLPIFLFFGWYSFIDRRDQHEIWRTLYFEPGWQAFFNLFNSIPLFLLILAAAWKFGLGRLLLFSAAALLHFAEDFFIHRSDAHAHFFPFSDYIFVSPFSYWDSEGFGNYLSMAETVIVIAVSIMLFREIRSRWGKGLLIAANLTLLGSHSMWRFIFSYL